ncbi:oligosaccharide flippase family protein [Marinovum sp. 2_MG-2023]|uniref:oligosaccharide flippase family protein n=1 Tax=unclassified Marinovum TaxID=2647166 RepID=UPI0026E3952F|nr:MULTISPECIES: oligosaccharide flippase family protein [unclassified Marinovum]MDO6730120.1 oligosaccharide flippase family protein [Marinovum sp. 2_MG-2023]MDO6778858.1 oligosaccharide flippase family protein [Marinovum sp. 1_MG-2023]
MRAIARKLSGGSLTARALRSGLFTVGGFGMTQLVRLGSNLILTRILFPEAFGLMALTMVFLQGLQMFSDVGVSPAIQQSKRGDDADFLDTAWTIQVVRGFGLWLAACAMAWPLAQVYDEPQLVMLLPLMSLTLIIQGFNPTKMETANRHLILGRVTLLEIATQLVGVFFAILLAYWLQSVFALVVSGIVSMAAQLWLNMKFLPGRGNQFRWEKPAVQELINFGKWIFLSTLVGFLFHQGDKIILGRYLPIDQFGVYNIGFFLASFPMLLGMVVTRKVLIPIYRETPPGAAAENFAKLRRMRVMVTSGLMVLQAIFAASGVWLVGVMYDDRYAMAGPVAVVIAIAQLPLIVALTYDQTAVAAGDSRRFFGLQSARAAFMIIGLLAGVHFGGLFGAIAGQGVAMIAVYPVVVRLARKMKAWDPMHDLVFAVVGGLIALLAWMINGAAIMTLFPGAAT